MAVESARRLGGKVPANTLWIYASENAGRTWSRPADVVDASLATGVPDQPRLAVDPAHPCSLYLVWRQIAPSGFSTGDLSATAYFSRSSDGGRRWTTPREIYAPPTSFPQTPWLQHPFVLADGTLLDVFDQQNVLGILGIEHPAEVLAIRSRDRGRTWSAPIAIAAHSPRPTFPDPDGGPGVRAVDAASSAVAPNGTVYVAWGDRTGSKRLLRILISTSKDGGRTWSAPRQVARTRTVIAGPALAVAADGTVGVLYYDVRHDHPGDHVWTTDVYLAHSRDRGARWQENHLAGPFNLASGTIRTGAVNVPYVYLGDNSFSDLTGLPHGFAAAFPMAMPEAIHGPSDIFFAHIALRRRMS
jgi:hypothetical protein